MVRLPWGWAAGVITQISNLRDWKRCPSLNNGTGNFGGLKGVFFKKQGILGQNQRVRPLDTGATRKSVGRSRRLRDARTSDTLQLCRTIARPLDQAVFRRLAIAGGPCIPSCGPAFDRSAASHQPGAHLTLSAPGEAGAQYLLRNVLFVMAITYVGPRCP